VEDIQRLPAPIRFGVFEVDLQAGELRRQGIKVKLQDQPFQVLTMLLERSGEVVTREELQKKLWPADTFVDFERGLNRAINKLREALADDADRPRFIETLPRRGYRFLVVVETAGAHEVEGSGRKKLAILPSDRPHGTEALSTVASSRRQILPWSVVGILAVVTVVALLRPWRTPPNVPDRPFSQLDLDIGPDEFSFPAISPDGARIVFVSKQGLAIRRLDQSKTTLLAGTEGAAYPFFSPNGRWVAFFQAHKLQKIAVEGDVPIALCDAQSAGGGSWGDDDNIVAVVHDPIGLSRVPAAGGMPQSLAASKAAYSAGLMYLWPQVLPGSKAILFAATNANGQGSLLIFTPNDGKTRTVVENSTYGRYLASGYLIYYQRGTLFAAPMDARRLELTGAAVPLVDGVAKFEQGRADFDLSSSGTLVYQRGTERSNAVLSWLYSSGRITPVLSEPGEYSTPRLSPDGTRLALSVLREGKQNLWIYDLGRETFTRLTSEQGPDSYPTWTADGEFVIFQSGNVLAWTRADGSGNVERLAGISNAGPWSFSADGKWLAFWPLQPGSDLWAAPVERKPGVLRLGQPQPLLQQAGSQGAPAISPDDRWVAYTSDESGRFETYVMPFSQGKAAGGKWQISNGGGWAPRWSGNGRELFYQSRNDQRVQVVSYTVKGDSFIPEKPRQWSEARGSAQFFTGYDVAPDGKRVLMLSAAETVKPETHLRVLLNVDSELRRRAPSYRE
jgi:Tol biopolymer transport system component/DNA-binding winged helix-turn-helix (wHTH) protein